MIRKAISEDFQSVLPLAHRFFDATKYGDMIAFDDESFRNTYEQLLTGGVVLLAEVGGIVVGAAGALAYPFYFNANHKTGQEVFWWVNEEARGASVGGRLFKALEAWAKEEGCQTFSMITLDSLNPEEVSAMYLRAGYRGSERSFIKEL